MVPHCSDRRVSPSGPHRKRGNRAKMAAQAVRIGTIVVRKKTRARFRSDDKESRARKRMWSPRDSEAAEVRRDGHRKPAEEEVWGLGDAAWRPVSWPEFGQVGGLAVPSASLRSSPNPGIRITRRGKGEGERRGKEKNGKGNAIHGQNVSWAVSWLASEVYIYIYIYRRKTPCARRHLISFFTSLTFRFQLLSFFSFRVP